MLSPHKFVSRPTHSKTGAILSSVPLASEAKRIEFCASEGVLHQQPRVQEGTVCVAGLPRRRVPASSRIEAAHLGAGW